MTYYEDDEAYILEDNNEEEPNQIQNNEDNKDIYDLNSNREEDENKEINYLSDSFNEKPQNNEENSINILI